MYLKKDEEVQSVIDTHKSILIWGAGKIGRGFAADLFDKAGWEITFLDSNPSLIANLGQRKSYTLSHFHPDGEREVKTIRDFHVLDFSQQDEVLNALQRVRLVTLSVFPPAFPQVAHTLCRLLEIPTPRIEPLDIILCANIPSPAQCLYRELIQHKKGNEIQQHFGLVDTVVLRIVVDPPSHACTEDPLALFTNGYPDLPADRRGFLGTPPEVEGLCLTDDIHREEIRKLYTYNMAHALIAYLGALKGYTYIAEALEDPEIIHTAQCALSEVGRALVREFGFSPLMMENWNKKVLPHLGNPLLRDTVVRVGADPARKLSPGDRLSGSVKLCLKHGILPRYIARGIAAAFCFKAPQDPSSHTIQSTMKREGLKGTLHSLCGLGKDEDFIRLVADWLQRDNFSPDMDTQLQEKE